MSEYLDFVEVHDTGKTKTWSVRSRSGGYELAQVKWHGAWRCYTLQPGPQTIWNVGCLETVNAFIAAQMDARKRTRDDVHA